MPRPTWRFANVSQCSPICNAQTHAQRWNNDWTFTNVSPTRSQAVTSLGYRPSRPYCLAADYLFTLSDTLLLLPRDNLTRKQDAKIKAALFRFITDTNIKLWIEYTIQLHSASCTSTTEVIRPTERINLEVLYWKTTSVFAFVDNLEVLIRKSV